MAEHEPIRRVCICIDTGEWEPDVVVLATVILPQPAKTPQEAESLVFRKHVEFCNAVKQPDSDSEFIDWLIEQHGLTLAPNDTISIVV